MILIAAGAGSAGTEQGSSWAGPRSAFAKRVCTSALARWGNCGAQVVASQDGTPLAGTTPSASSLTPAQLHSAYSLPTTAPSAGTIAIVDAYDHPAIESDLATYSSWFGLPACTTANGCFRKVDQFGGTTYPAPDSGWALEIAMDVEIAHAMCQNCKILLVEARSASIADLGAAVNRAALMGANAISNSYGAREYSTETNDEKYYNHPGIAVTASTGDNGFGVEFPASSRYVTAVGGTTLALNSDGTRAGETVWNGAGSGCSLYVPKPAWQKDVGCARRTNADVAAVADPNTGAAVYDSVSYSGQQGWFQVGGTSLATPIIAATYVLAGNTAAVNGASGLYGSAGLLYDVTSGSNGVCSPAYLCKGGAGYDGPTGLGTPNGTGAFGGSGSPASPDFSVGASPSTQTVAPGGSTSYTVSVSGSGGFSGSVSFSVSGLPAGASGSFSPTSVSGSGSTTLSITTTGSVATGDYPLTITGTSGSLQRSASATLSVQSSSSPDFAVGVTPSSRTVTAGGGTTYSVSVSFSGGFAGTVGLTASGLPSGVTTSFSPPSLSSASSSTLTLSTGAVAAGTYTFSVTGTSGGVSHSASATLVVQSSSQTPDFSISLSPSAVTMLSTDTKTVTINVNRVGGFSGAVTFINGFVPYGVKLTYSPNPTSGSSATLTVTTTRVGHQLTPIRVTITGRSNGLSRSTTLSISV